MGDAAEAGTFCDAGAATDPEALFDGAGVSLRAGVAAAMQLFAQTDSGWSAKTAVCGFAMPATSVGLSVAAGFGATADGAEEESEGIGGVDATFGTPGGAVFVTGGSVCPGEGPDFVAGVVFGGRFWPAADDGSFAPVVVAAAAFFGTTGLVALAELESPRVAAADGSGFRAVEREEMTSIVPCGTTSAPSVCASASNDAASG